LQTKSKNENMKKARLKVDASEAAGRVKKILPILKKNYPDAGVTLNFSNPLELLIATILAAQCTDRRVNIVTESLFKKYRGVADWSSADVKQIEQDIKSTGFFRNKAVSIKRACGMIMERFDGQVPSTMEELLELPGVGRKTANVILGNAFNIPGVVCDPHVIRLSRRFGLSANSDPVKLEFDLMGIVAKKDWTLFSHLLVFHGRSVCRARRPDCGGCVISRYCPSADEPDLW